jgi:hypothetical protein
MRFRTVAVFSFVALLSAALPVMADNLTGVTTGNIGVQDPNSKYVAPYSATLNGSAVTVYCDDIAHTIGSGSYTVNVETIANLTGAKYAGVSGATQLYEEAFYLSTYLGTYSAPAVASTRTVVQDAIWYLFNNTYFTSNSNYTTSYMTSVQSYVTQAQANYNHYSYTNFKILTPTDGTQGLNGTASQELFTNSGTPLFTVATPEPASYSSMLAGLGVLAFGIWRRHRVVRLKKYVVKALA